MKLTIKNKEIQLDNKNISIDELYSIIEREIDKTNELLDFMIIDNIEVYLDHKDYIKDNIKYIENIEVKTITIKGLIENILLTGLDYIENSIPIIEKLADEFYKSPLTEDWNNINDLFEGISWIIESFYYIDKDSGMSKNIKNREAWNIYVKSIYELIEILSEMERGIIAKDNILIGDLLSYEIVPIFENMINEILDIVRVDK